MKLEGNLLSRDINTGLVKTDESRALNINTSDGNGADNEIGGNGVGTRVDKCYREEGFLRAEIRGDLNVDRWRLPGWVTDMLEHWIEGYRVRV